MKKPVFKIVTEKEIVTKEVVETEVSLLEYIGIQLKEKRESSDINIAQLSRRLNNSDYSISSTTIGKIEKGDCPLKIEDLRAISGHFGCKMSDFYPEGVL